MRHNVVLCEGIIGSGLNSFRVSVKAKYNAQPRAPTRPEKHQSIAITSLNAQDI